MSTATDGRYHLFVAFPVITLVPEDWLLMTLMLGMVEGSQQPGICHEDGFNDILELCGQDVKGAALMAEERNKWRRFVARTDHGIKE